MKTISSDYVRTHLEFLIEELYEIHEPIRIEGKTKKAVVMIKAEDFNKYFQSDENTRSVYGGKKSVKSLFGILRHRAKTVPLSIEKMEMIWNKQKSFRK